VARGPAGHRCADLESGPGASRLSRAARTPPAHHTADPGVTSEPEAGPRHVRGDFRRTGVVAAVAGQLASGAWSVGSWRSRAPARLRASAPLTGDLTVRIGTRYPVRCVATNAKSAILQRASGSQSVRRRPAAPRSGSEVACERRGVTPPSQAMWCITIISTCSRGSNLEDVRPHWCLLHAVMSNPCEARLFQRFLRVRLRYRPQWAHSLLFRSPPFLSIGPNHHN